MQQKKRNRLFIFIILVFLFFGLFSGVLWEKYFPVGDTILSIRNELGMATFTPNPTSTLSPTLASQNIIGTLQAKGVSPFFVFVGDSLTCNKEAGDVPNRYPSKTMSIIGSYNFINLGISSANVEDLNTYESTNIDQLVNQSHKFVLLVWIGANDYATPLSAFTQDLTAYWQKRRAAGYKIIAFTVLPRGDKSPLEQVAMNDWIRDNWKSYCDGLVDVAVVPELQDPTNLDYFNKDEIHLTDAGNTIVAKLVSQAVANLK
jgi:lysophospholipase L1-like esterase